MASRKDKKIEKRIEWLLDIRENRIKKRFYQVGWTFCDSKGNRVELEPLADANYQFLSSDVIDTTSFPRCDEKIEFGHFKFSRLEASLILGRDSQFYSRYLYYPQPDKIQNWELQAMLKAASAFEGRGVGYSFGDLKEIFEKSGKVGHLILPVQYYGRAEIITEKWINPGEWDENDLIKKVREELKQKTYDELMAL